MPKVKKRGLAFNRTYHSGHYFHLMCGHDYFDGFGRGPEAIEAMRQAWEDPAVRAAVYDLVERRRVTGHKRTIPWAAEVFADD